MKKFEAARKFVEVLKAKPLSFTVKHHQQERCSERYTIEHTASKVSVTIRIDDGKAKYDGMNRADNINYADQETTDELLKFAMNRVLEDKVNALIKADNTLIDTLLDHH